jgi:hypothetical protein
MLQQALIYARAVLYAQDRKWVLCILFHWTERKVRFCFFCRSGVISTPSYDLDDKDGFEVTVRGFVGMLSLRDKAAAGTLPSETIQEWLRGLTGKTYIEGECLLKRITVHGCGTKAANHVEQRVNSAVTPALSQEADEMEARELAWPIRVSPTHAWHSSQPPGIIFALMSTVTFAHPTQNQDPMHIHSAARRCPCPASSLPSVVCSQRHPCPPCLVRPPELPSACSLLALALVQLEQARFMQCHPHCHTSPTLPTRSYVQNDPMMTRRHSRCWWMKRWAFS